MKDRGGPREERGIVSVAGASAGSPLLAVRNLTKLFGTFAACNGIDLDVWSYTRPSGPEMADLLEALRERGVQFDDSLLEALREEPS